MNIESSSLLTPVSGAVTFHTAKLVTAQLHLSISSQVWWLIVLVLYYNSDSYLLWQTGSTCVVLFLCRNV